MGTSAIDATKPIEGNPTTQSVRDNFAAAKSEIIQLQDDATAETTRVDGALDAKSMRAGDLSGTTASTTVSGIQNRAVASTAPTNGQGLVWNGTQWAPANTSELQGRSVANTAPTNGQQLRWNGTAWAPATNTVTLSGGVTGTGDASAGAITTTVEQLQGRAVANTIPAAGQALIWSGSAWTPTTGTGNPAAIVHRAMTADLHGWLTGAGEGFFAGEGSPTNLPPVAGTYKFQGQQNAAGNNISILAFHNTTNRIWHKVCNAGTWLAWIEVETNAVQTVGQGAPNFNETPASSSPAFPTTPNMATAAPTVGAGWTPDTGGTATTTYTHTGGTAPLSFPITAVAVGDIVQVIFTLTNTSTLTSGFLHLHLGAAAGTNTQTITTNASGSLTMVVRVTGAFTWLNIVPVTTWTGNFTLTRIVRAVTLNSSSYSIKTNWTTVLRGNSCFEGGGGRVATGSGNDAFGSGALQGLTTGNYNTAFGENALQNCTTTSYCTAIGYLAGQFNSTGTYNTALGALCLVSNQNGTYNTAVGYRTLYACTSGGNNTAVGRRPLQSMATGSFNVAVGNYVMTGVTNVSYNVGVGEYALGTVTGSYNTAVGQMALRQTGTHNNTVGVGSNAGRYAGAGTTQNTEAGNSVYIGADTRSSAVNQTNQIVIGYNALGGGSNTITLGNGSITQLRCNVQSISALSDTRVKDEIQPANLDRCLDAVRNLPVHRWHWQAIAGAQRDRHVTGFLSGELRKIWPHRVTEADEYLTVRDEDGNPKYITVTETIPPEPDEPDAEPIVQTRQIEETVKIEGLSRVELTEVLPTLWGAVQKLIQKIDDLTGGGSASDAPEHKESKKRKGGD